MRSSCVVSIPLLLPLVPTPPQPTFFPPLKATTVRVRHFTFNVYFFVCGKDRTLPVFWDGALERDGSFETGQSFLPESWDSSWNGSELLPEFWDGALQRVRAFCQNPGTGLCNGSELFARIQGMGQKHILLYTHVCVSGDSAYNKTGENNSLSLLVLFTDRSCQVYKMCVLLGVFSIVYVYVHGTTLCVLYLHGIAVFLAAYGMV